MFGLDQNTTILVLICLIAVFAFEFINGFHDTANAVATVIYTNALKPVQAVVWSGLFNFIGVITGGVAVAMSLLQILDINMLYQQTQMENIALILAVLITAIFWNLATWYYGIPSSSSHTLIGSIVGVGIAYNLMLPSETTLIAASINWKKLTDIGLALLISPLMGFTITVIVMFTLKKILKKKKVFKEPKEGGVPPPGVRALLIATCTAVSYTHGSNDGQKGLGLVMILLLAIVPSSFMINPELTTDDLMRNTKNVQMQLAQLDSNKIQSEEKAHYLAINQELSDIQSNASLLLIKNHDTKIVKYEIRKSITHINKEIKFITGESNGYLKSIFKSEAFTTVVDTLTNHTNYAPFWAIIMISLALGVGTMIGWKRIVVTIGEKIGKEHMSYAQGASAEMVTAISIFTASQLKLPVSTTHLLSSSVAGAMVAERGIKNLQTSTIKSMALAWLFTLPVTVIGSGILFWLLKFLIA